MSLKISSFKFYFLISCFIIFSAKVRSQYISIYGVNHTRVLSDYNRFDFDISSAAGGAICYNNYLGFGFNYNAGGEFLSCDGSNIYLLQTGLSKILTSPSSFSHAKNKESVSMTTNNWLTSIDLNIYNGIITESGETAYVFAAEPCYTLAYALGKKKNLFIGGEIGVHYMLFPETSTISIPLKFGFRYQI